MHKKIVKKLVENKNYFNEQKNIICSRTIGINDYGFRYDDNYCKDRQNIWFFSNDFEKILIDDKNDKFDDKNDKYKENNTKKQIDQDDIQKLFYENKDKLKDLSWIIYKYG